MRSTFMGLEAAKSGLFTQQSALYTTGHNISNANTEGYSRQRVNMQATPGFPTAGLNSPQFPGHMGTGVEAGAIQRVRDQFIDRQFRQETSKLGYWETKTQSISQMEDIMTEPSEYGIAKAFTEFWKTMEDVVANPKDTAARQVMISKGEALAESFNYMDMQLKQIQGNIGNEIAVETKEVNSILKQIAEINKQIMAVEPNGYVPNDLYDARDVLVDQLNELLPVSIERVPSGGNANEVAEGSLTVKFIPAGGTANDAITLVRGKEYAAISTLDSDGNPVDGNPDNADTDGYLPFAALSITNIGEPPTEGDEAASIAYENFEMSKGKILSLINAYGHGDPAAPSGIYPEMLANLDRLAATFVEQFNLAHQDGYTLATATEGSVAGEEMFFGTTAKEFKVVDGFRPIDIAASDAEGEEGNNKNIMALAKLQATVQDDLNGSSFDSYYQSLIGDLGVQGQESIRMEYNAATLKLTIENNRASMSSVSLDEEMSNLITFQQAYNANARMITVVDETLDKIINGMGRVGL